MIKSQQQAYRLGVGAMIVNKDKKIFVGKRKPFKSAPEPQKLWQMPQGGIDLGEDPQAALMRELNEEIGTNDIRIIDETKEWLRYELPNELVPQFFNGAFIGQKQKWYLVFFNGSDRNINIATKEPEFVEWKWVSQKELLELVVDFKAPLYQTLMVKFHWFFQ
jgi:putative (di)nucleoside polyphosphate hydrolase